MIGFWGCRYEGGVMQVWGGMSLGVTRYEFGCYRDGAAISARAKNKKGPKPTEHVQLFRMKRDRNKGFCSELC